MKQFGYNNDYVAFIPIGDDGNGGLLCVNHEYTNEEIMFPGIVRQDLICFPDMTSELVDIEMAAHGVTIVEIARKDGAWRPVPRQQIQPPHQSGDSGDERRRAGGRSRPHEDKRRSIGGSHSRHAEQLRRRGDALGHI